LAAAWRFLAEKGQTLSFTAHREEDARGFWNEAELHPFTTAPAVSLSDTSAEQFAVAHSRLGRQVRRLQRAGAELIHSTGANSPLVGWIYEQKAAQLANDPNNVFADVGRRDFMVEIAAAEADRCDIYCFRRSSEIISCVLTFRDRGDERDVRRFYTIYFDQAWAHYSPGTALLYEVTHQTLAEGLDADYMTGEQPHKMRLASRFVPLHRVEATPEIMLAYADALSARVAA
jgi:hypothetical protein